MYQIYLKPYKNIVQLLTRFWICKKGDFFLLKVYSSWFREKIKQAV